LRIDRVVLDIDSIPRDEVLRYLGYKGQGLSAGLDARVEDMMARCLEVAKPVAALRSHKVLRIDEGEEGCVARPEVVLEGTALRLTGHDVTRHLRGAREVVLMAVTLGVGVDVELRRLALVDAVGQVAFDAAASAAVECAVDAAEALARRYAAESGAYCGRRFSPGYGDLPLGIQGSFLKMLNAQRRIGLTVTDSMLLIPSKSVTALIGISDTPIKRGAKGCAVCNMRESCAYRLAGGCGKQR
jgi:hypothetical protein